MKTGFKKHGKENMSLLGSKYPQSGTERVQIISACVANYDEMTNLSGVRQDWQSLEQLFIGDPESSIFKPEQFTLLKDPTISKLQSTILEYSQSRSASGDLLIFYFSGHGVVFGDREFHLCLKDTKLTGDDVVLPLSTIPMKSIIQTVALANVIPCFILDSCFSGTVVKESEQNIGISLEMQASQTLADKYAVFASSAENSISKGTEEGGYFTNAIVDTAYEGLESMDHLPFITLENIVSSVDKQLEKIGAPLSRVRMGRGFPELQLAKNKNYHPVQSIEKFQPSYKPFLKLLWNEGNPQCITLEEIRQWDATTYGNHTKFEEKWGLVEDGKTVDGTRCRRLTQKGIEFVLGKIEIPNEVHKKYGEDSWIPTNNSVQISYDDL